MYFEIHFNIIMRFFVVDQVASFDKVFQLEFYI